MAQLTQLFFVVVVSLGYFLIRRCVSLIHERQQSARHGCELPPSLQYYDWIFGFDVVIKTFREMQSHVYLSRSCERFLKYGNTYSTRMNGCPGIWTCEPENVKAILATYHEEFEFGKRRKHAFQRMLGDGIFAAEGPEWNHSRRLLRPTFAKESISNIVLLEKHVCNLIEAIDVQQHKDGQCNIQDLFFSFTLDIATEMFLGESVGSLTQEDDIHTKQRFSLAFDRSQRQIVADFVLGPLAAFRSRKNHADDRVIIFTFLNRNVERALSAKKYAQDHTSTAGQPAADVDTGKRYIVLEELIEHTTDPIRLRDEMLSLLVAGRDSTASLLSSLWFCLSRNAVAYSRLQQEVEKLGTERPVFARLKEMKYLQACLHECEWICLTQISLLVC